MKTKKNTTKFLLLGFGLISILFIISGIGWLYTLDDGESRLEEITIAEKEARLFNKMKTIGFQRITSVLRMIIKKDEFDRDEEHMFLRLKGSEFLKLRETLFSEHFSNHGEVHWGNVADAAAKAQQTQLKIIDLLAEDRDQDAVLMMDKLFSTQTDIAKALDDETTIVENELFSVLNEATKTNKILGYMSGVLLFISIGSGFYVIRYVVIKIHRAESALTDYGEKIREIYNISTEMGVDAEEQITHMLIIACQLLNMDHAVVIESSNNKETLYEFSRSDPLRKKVVDVIKNKLCDPFIYSNDVQSVSNIIDFKFENGELKDLSGINSCLSIPFKVDNVYYGVLCVLDKNKRESKFISEDFDLIKLVSSWLGFAIERNIDNKKLKSLKEEAESASNTKSEFLGNMSHELRTPMHAILSYSGFGVKRFNTANNEKKLSYFTKIEKSANTLLKLLDDILDISKLEANKMEFVYKENDFNENIVDVIDEFGAMANEYDVIIECDFETKEYKMNFDLNRIKQVVRNLVSNAIKFSNKGGNITLKTSTDEAGILLSVIDHGLGIPENELNDIFDKFKQSSKTNSGAGGTGLGLAICREIVLAHKGKIWAENNYPEGTIIKVSIPLDLSCVEYSKVS